MWCWGLLLATAATQVFLSAKQLHLLLLWMLACITGQLSLIVRPPGTLFGWFVKRIVGPFYQCYMWIFISELELCCGTIFESLFFFLSASVLILTLNEVGLSFGCLYIIVYRLLNVAYDILKLCWALYPVLLVITSFGDVPIICSTLACVLF